MTSDAAAKLLEVNTGAILAAKRAELAELDRDAEELLATEHEDMATARRKLRDEVANLEAAEAGKAKQPTRIGALLDSVFGRLLGRARGEEKAVPVPWPSLANLLGGGLWPGAHVLVAGTGTGKTQLQLQLALNAATEGVPVLYIGLELGELETVARLVALLEDARKENVKASDLLQGKVPSDRLENLFSAANVDLAELPLELETGDAHGWDYLRLVPAVRALRARHGVDDKAPVLVVLDYLQLVSSPIGAREDIRERIGRAAYQAREAARHANAAVLVTSSLARGNDKLLGEWGRAWPAESASDGAGLFDLVGLGKEAGEVEFSADSVIVMARTSKVEGEKETRVRVGVPKHRNGPAGETTLLFNGSRWADDDEREKKARALLARPSIVATRPKAKGGSKGADKAAGYEP